jgi:hypothetical protein
MSCTNCNNNNCANPNCGCETGLTTPAPCNPIGCPDPYPCTEITDAQCVIYSDADIVCDQDIVVESNTNVSEALNSIVGYFCGMAPTPGEVAIVESGAGINVTSTVVGNTTTYTVAIQDTGWTDLEGFAYYQLGMSTNKPQVRKIGKQIHFRGDLYIPLSSGSGVVPLNTPDTYRTVTRQNPWIGTGGMYNDGTNRLLFNSNGSAAQSVIPTSVLPALTNLDGTYKLSRLIATRQIEVLSSLLGGQSGTATLTAPVTIEILSDKTLRVTPLQQLEENAADIVSFDGNSALRNITSSYVARDRVIDLSKWLNATARSGLNSRNTPKQAGGLLTIGRTYMILDYNPGDDFTNVGALNVTGNIFTATGSVPTTWTNQSILYYLNSNIDITEEYFFDPVSNGAAQWGLILDGSTFNAAEFNSLGGFKISLDGLSAYIA